MPRKRAKNKKSHVLRSQVPPAVPLIVRTAGKVPERTPLGKAIPTEAVGTFDMTQFKPWRHRIEVITTIVFNGGNLRPGRWLRVDASSVRGVLERYGDAVRLLDVITNERLTLDEGSPHEE